MKKIVNFCGNCPFSYSDYDDFAMGYSTVNTCTLANFLKLKDHIITMYDGIDCEQNIETPKWCPLKNEEVSIEFKEFSTEIKQEINSIWKEINDLQEKYDNYDLDKLDERDDKLQELYTRLGELQINEDPNEDDELSKNIDTIKEQLLYLENASKKLQESLGNLGE